MLHIGNDEHRIAKSTAVLTTVEFEQYISQIVSYASGELCLAIPDPEGYFDDVR